MRSKLNTASANEASERIPRMNNPNHAIAMPIKKITIVRRSIFIRHVRESVKSYFFSEKYVEMPIMYMKKGNTRSVGVRPFHSAWARGAYMCPQEPGLFTRIIPAMVIPRRMSRASRRLPGDFFVVSIVMFGVF